MVSDKLSYMCLYVLKHIRSMYENICSYSRRTLELRKNINTLILFSILIADLLSRTDLTVDRSIYNTINFVLCICFVLLNPAFNKVLSGIFLISITLILLSMLFNASQLHSGSINAFMFTSVSWVMLSLNRPVLNYSLMRVLIYNYLIIGIGLSIYYLLSDYDFNNLVQNKNFNINPNGASIYFLGSIMLTFVVTNGWKMWMILSSYVLLILTTGSRAGMVSMSLMLIIFAIYDHKLNIIPRHTAFKNIFRRVFYFTGLLFSLYLLMPSCFEFAFRRLIQKGVSISDSEFGRMEKWGYALNESTTSLQVFLFGKGPAMASDSMGGGLHSSYVEAFASFGWPYLFIIILGVLVVFRQNYLLTKSLVFILIGGVILLHGSVETILFRGVSSLWAIFIFISFYYQGLRGKSIR